tara:strand:+ start:7692 stop:8822 length:1131 start_codon:yes stop_codon:yes gene_type:complete
MTISEASLHCNLASNGFDQRNGGACCFIKREKKSDPYWKHTPKSYMHDPFIQEVRQALDRGEQHWACETCWQDENNGKQSKRQHSNIALKSASDGELTHLSIMTGNKCNLACRTCGSHSSTGWYKEHLYVRKQKPNMPGFAHNPPIKEFNDNINVPLDKLQRIEVLGGEPFYEQEHLKFIERVCREADPSCITLFYSTNGTKKIDPEIEKMFSKFKQIDISFSIDAVGKKFEYIRTLGKWDQVEDTIAYWKKQSNVYIKNHATISILNMLYMKELWDYFIDKQNFMDSQMGYTYALFPPTYNFSIISHDKRHRNWDYIMDNMQFGQHTESIRNYFKNTDFNDNNFEFFKKQINYTKEFRKLDIENYLPELCRVLEL